MNLPATLRALRYRNFQLFFAGQLISVIGTWMQNVAQAWLVYRLTGSSVLLGSIGFAGQIPMLLFTPIAGIVADQYDRRKIIIATQTLSMLLAFALAVPTLTGAIQVWHIFALSIALGIVNAFDVPVRQSFFVEMVGREDLMNAIALNSTMFNLSRVLGPAIAGILVAEIGEGWCFFVNAVSYLAVIAGLMMMRMPPRERTESKGSPLADFIEGFRFVVTHTPVHAIIALLGVVSMAAMPYMVLMPIFADRVLHGGSKAMGWLMGSAGMGALAGALILASRTRLTGLATWIAGAAVAFGAMLIAFSYSVNFWLSAALLVAVGFFMMLQFGSSNTLVQSMSPDSIRGRVISLYATVYSGMIPFGSLLAGFASDRIGAPQTVRIGGALTIAAAAGFATLLPRIRAGARELIAAQRT